MEDRFKKELDEVNEEFEVVLNAIDHGQLEGNHATNYFRITWRVLNWAELPRVLSICICSSAPMLDPVGVAASFGKISGVQNAYVCGVSKRRQKELEKNLKRHDQHAPVIAVDFVVSPGERAKRLSTSELDVVKKLLAGIDRDFTGGDHDDADLF